MNNVIHCIDIVIDIDYITINYLRVTYLTRDGKKYNAMK